jgi:hypothetical protein
VGNGWLGHAAGGQPNHASTQHTHNEQINKQHSHFIATPPLLLLLLLSAPAPLPPCCQLRLVRPL